MNLTLDQYINGFERSVKNLPSLLAEWDSIDPDLMEEYIEQLEWLLKERPNVLQRAAREGRYAELRDRIAAATIALSRLHEGVTKKMGIGLEQILVVATVALQD